jgi:hypothetical protein
MESAGYAHVAVWIVIFAGVLLYKTGRWLIVVVPIFWRNAGQLHSQFKAFFKRVKAGLQERASRQPKPYMWIFWFLVLCAIPVGVVLLPVLLIFCGLVGLVLLYLAFSALVSRELAK